jgi:murein DD-endopeptidase MepM/ murein hydrolase activator NlpD
MVITLLLALSAITANLGSAVPLRLPAEPGVVAVEGEWQQKKVPFVRVKDEWISLVGIDLDVKPGEYKLGMSLKFNDGRTEKRDQVIAVQPTEYPTTQLTVEEKYVELNPKDLARANREAKEINTIYASTLKEMLWTTPFTLPIPGEASGRNFGHRRVFNGEPRAPHNGADLRAATGTPIHSANRGRVVLAKNLFFTGNTVIVDHGLGVILLYAHLSRIDVKVGQIVENGQIVGLSGATGRVTGPHLHWGVRIQGARVDPFALVQMK